jgi:nucleotide-binding universal stress UspA family protein
MTQQILIPLAYEVALQCQPSPWRKPPYRKILVPLDGSVESECAIELGQKLLPSGGEGILLRVIPPENSDKLGERREMVSNKEKARHAGAMGYLNGVVGHLVQSQGRWRCEVVISDSVVDAIADFAIQENVDLIAMFTHDRKGIAKLVKGSIAEKVQQKVNVPLRVSRPGELPLKWSLPSLTPDVEAYWVGDGELVGEERTCGRWSKLS